MAVKYSAPKSTNTIEMEVRNAAHLVKLLAALRAADAVSTAVRVRRQGPPANQGMPSGTRGLDLMASYPEPHSIITPTTSHAPSTCSSVTFSTISLLAKRVRNLTT